MLRAVAAAVGLVAMLAVTGVGQNAFAQGIGNSCNARVTKAVGKKMACRLGLYAQGQKKSAPANTTKLAACDTKFMNACAKAQTKGSCDPAHADCAGKETAADNDAAALSPSGAFLNASAARF